MYGRAVIEHFLILEIEQVMWLPLGDSQIAITLDGTGKTIYGFISIQKGVHLSDYKAGIPRLSRQRLSKFCFRGLINGFMEQSNLMDENQSSLSVAPMQNASRLANHMASELFKPFKLAESDPG